ncbi:MAG TPA: YheE family protein [Pseudobacillus sp.]
MLLHFQYKPLYKEKNLPGWTFSFYYKKQRLLGNYLGDGTIEWLFIVPKETDRKQLEQQIHDLMLYHVYDN